MIDKNPSIYTDRGAIGSTDELDEYGVWVKSEPQDLSFLETETQNFSDPAHHEIEDLPDFGTEEFGSIDFGEDAFNADEFNPEEFTFDEESEPETIDVGSLPASSSPAAPAKDDDLAEFSLEDLGLLPNDMGIPPDKEETAPEEDRNADDFPSIPMDDSSLDDAFADDAPPFEAKPAPLPPAPAP
ncbi:MAG: hypothetical protein LBG76_04755, partial [Treponema sp.]|nr:hypothetical protein [Treponema sp.]